MRHTLNRIAVLSLSCLMAFVSVELKAAADNHSDVDTGWATCFVPWELPAQGYDLRPLIEPDKTPTLRPRNSVPVTPSPELLVKLNKGEVVTLTKSSVISVQPNAGTLFDLEQGSGFLIAELNTGGKLLLSTADAVALVQGQDYEVEVTDGPVPVVRGQVDGGFALPAGAKVKLVLTPRSKLFAQGPLLATPVVSSDRLSTLVADIVPRESIGMRMAMRLLRPGQDFDPRTRRFAACAANRELPVDWSGPQAVPVAIETVKADAPGEARADLEIPYEILPKWQRSPLTQTLDLVVASSDGLYLGRVELTGFSVINAVFLSTFAVLLLALLIGAVGYRRYRRNGDTGTAWLVGAIVGHKGEPSISQFQILLWTIVTVWAGVYVIARTSDLLVMTPEVMGLLGFAGAGSVAARWVGASRTAGVAPAECRTARFWEILQTRDHLDLFKLQLFLFTVLIAGYVALRVAMDAAFPKLDPNFLLLMGVSNGLYVGSKVAVPAPADDAEAAKVRYLVAKEELVNLAQRKQQADTALAAVSHQVVGDPDYDAAKTAVDHINRSVADAEQRVRTLHDEWAKLFDRLKPPAQP